MSETTNKKSERAEREDSGMEFIMSLASVVFKELKRSFYIVLILIIIVPAALCVRRYYTYNPAYKASATFAVQIGTGYSQTSTYYSSETARQLSETFPYIISSGVLNNTIAKDLNISSVPAIKASYLPQTNIFTLEVESGSAQLAYDVLHSAMENYPSIAEFVVGTTRLVLLSETGVPSEPYNRLNYRGSITTGVAIGLVLGVAIVAMIALIRPTVKSKEDLQRIVNIKYLGSVPRISFKNKSNKSRISVTLLNKNLPNTFIDAIRLVRTRIDKIATTNGYKVMMFTSAISGEGKTTTAINLAISLVKKGNKVALMDCDMRNSSVMRSMGRTNEKGISDYVLADAELDEFKVTNIVPGLTVLPAGTAVQGASEVTAMPKLRELIDKMRQENDYVIIDTPPCSILADATVLAQYVDCAFFVIGQDYASKSRILDGISYLTKCDINVEGCVLNYADTISDTSPANYRSYGRDAYLGSR